MKTVCYFILTACLATLAWAQPDVSWSRTFGGSGLEECTAVEQTTDGGYILGGWTESFGAGNQDFWLVKTNASGDSLWSRTYGGRLGDHCRSLQQTSDGGYILAGGSASFGGGDMDGWLLKTNATGDSLWSCIYASPYFDQFESVQQTPDGGYILGGGTLFGDDRYYNMLLVKTNASGDTLWTRNFGGSGDDYCTVVRQTTDGGYALAGYTSTGAGEAADYDFWLVKTDSNGDSLWSHAYGDSSFEECFALQQTHDGGYILGGFRSRSRADGAMLVIKTDPDGNVVWSRTYGGLMWESCTSIVQTSDGGYILGGDTWTYGAGMDDMWIVRMASNGDSLWSRTYGGSDEDYCLSLQPTSDGGYILGGATKSFGSGLFDFWLVKTGPDPLTTEIHFILDPSSFSLSSYPNPFNPTTTLSFSLPKAGRAKIVIYDIAGREVRTLEDQFINAGEHRVAFDGSALPSGIYFARIENGASVATQKLLLLK